MFQFWACQCDKVRPPEKVFEMYEDHEGANYYSLPPVIANKALPEKEKTKEVKSILKEINHLKVLTLDTSKAGEEAFSDIQHKLEAYSERKNMKEMIRITHNGENISVLMHEENGQLKEVLVNIHGNAGFRGISMEGDLTIDNIIKLINNVGFDDLEKLLNH